MCENIEENLKEIEYEKLIAALKEQILDDMHDLQLNNDLETLKKCSKAYGLASSLETMMDDIVDTWCQVALKERPST